MYLLLINCIFILLQKTITLILHLTDTETVEVRGGKKVSDKFLFFSFTNV